MGQYSGNSAGALNDSTQPLLQVINNLALTNNVVDSFNSSWADSLNRRPSFYEVIEAFKRKEAMSEIDLREELFNTGVNNVDITKTRN